MTSEESKLLELAKEHGTPLFVYSRQYLADRAALLAGLQLPFGYTPRYAAKANNHPEIIKIFSDAGLSFDAGSSYEAVELMELGIPGSKISLSSQQPAHNLPELLAAGVWFMATSLHQLELFIDAVPEGGEVGLRVNPGLGSGHNNRTATGGANSSFGLWSAYVPDALKLAQDHNVRITKLHVHIGSGADPHMWRVAIETALEIAKEMPDVTTLNMGGGYKIRRFSDEKEADMVAIAQTFNEALTEFATETGRKLALEIEPGTWLVGHAGVILSEVVDKVDTGADGHMFLRLNTGMNDIIRPSMYGAQHEIQILTDTPETQEYVVVGHNCETGDILTPATGDPEGIEPREMRKADIGNVAVVYDCGAYCRTFAVKGYNSYPSTKEILV